MKATMRKKEEIERKELASFLKTTPEALQQFEDSYQYYAIDQNPETGNLFDEQKKYPASGMYVSRTFVFRCALWHEYHTYMGGKGIYQR